MRVLDHETFHIADTHFRLQTHPHNPLGRMQRDLFFRVADSDLREWQFLRSFYFDEAQNPAHMHAFCECIATDTEYLSASLKRSTRWAIRDDLFLRNCFNSYFQPNPFLAQQGSLMRAFSFFDEHVDAIITHPDYARIQAHDTASAPHPHQPDLAIAPIVSMLNERENVATLASCQGVSGTVHYEGYNIMTISSHARFAYIWFAHLPDSLAVQLSSHPAITYENTPHITLRATDNNADFLSALYQFLTH
ncbi:MAG: hypothetical protein AAFR81_07180 [Chloroflexota bacterium]